MHTKINGLKIEGEPFEFADLFYEMDRRRNQKEEEGAD